MADSKILGTNRVRLIDVTDSAVDPLESNAMNFGYEIIGVTFYVLSDKAGTFTVQAFLGAQDNDNPELLADAGWEDYPGFIASAVVAATMTEFTISDKGFPPLRVIYNPATAPHTTLVLAWGFGS